MAEYDGLPLNTPTKVSETADHETWATRTANGGTVEHRPKVGSNAGLAALRDARIKASVPTLRQWASDARGTTVTAGNAVATLQVVVNRLGTFFDGMADLIEASGRNGS